MIAELFRGEAPNHKEYLHLSYAMWPSFSPLSTYATIACLPYWLPIACYRKPGMKGRAPTSLPEMLDQSPLPRMDPAEAISDFDFFSLIEVYWHKYYLFIYTYIEWKWNSILRKDFSNPFQARGLLSSVVLLAQISYSIIYTWIFEKALLGVNSTLDKSSKAAHLVTRSSVQPLSIAWIGPTGNH